MPASQAWTVKLVTDPTAEIDLYGGVRLTWDKWTLDLGAMYYLLSGRASGSTAATLRHAPASSLPNGNTSLAKTDFLEFYGKLTYTFNDNFLVTGAVYYTDNWLNTGASGTYYSGIAEVHRHGASERLELVRVRRTRLLRPRHHQVRRDRLPRSERHRLGSAELHDLERRASASPTRR